MKAVHAVLLFVVVAQAASVWLVRKNFFVSRLLPWTDAQAYCRMYYDDLSVINSPWDLENFKKDVAAYLSEECWVGLSKKTNESVYTQWSDGSLIGFPVWKPDKPNYLNTFHCVAVTNMELHDFDCEQSLKFFCYKWVPQMVLVEEMMTWEGALQYCRTHYTDLISVITDDDMKAVKLMSLTSQTPSVWTGLCFMDGSWFWVNQDPLGSLISVPSCPIKPFRCGALKAGDDVWENKDCNEKMNFLCST